MSQVALFIRHKANPGRREEVQAIWEKWVKPRAAANPDHLQYYFCFDDEDPDSICVFQLFADAEAPRACSKTQKNLALFQLCRVN